MEKATVRGDAAHTIRSLIGSITIELILGEVVAKVEASAGAFIDLPRLALMSRSYGGTTYRCRLDTTTIGMIASIVRQ